MNSFHYQPEPDIWKGKSAKRKSQMRSSAKEKRRLYYDLFLILCVPASLAWIMMTQLFLQQTPRANATPAFQGHHSVIPSHLHSGGACGAEQKEVSTATGGPRPWPSQRRLGPRSRQSLRSAAAQSPRSIICINGAENSKAIAVVSGMPYLGQVPLSPIYPF